MGEKLIKYAFEAKLQCRTCLSVGRKMSAIGKLKDIFIKLFPENLNITISDVNTHLCWECIALLKKIEKFQKQIEFVFSMKKNEQIMLQSLSNLTYYISTEINNIVYLNSYTDKELTKQNGCTNFDKTFAFDNEKNVNVNPLINLKELQDKSCTDFDDNFKIGNVKTNIKKSKWALERLKQNKSMKYRILDNFENIFVKYNKEEVFNEKTIEREGLYKEREEIKCQKCLKYFESEIDLITHYKTQHKQKSLYICDTCKNVYNKKYLLIKHIQTHNYIYKCNVCLSVCTNTDQHRKLHRKIFECVICKLLFSNRAEFFRHYKDFHEKFQCDYCGVAFKMKYCIENHIRKRHSPFNCSFCKKSFSRYNALWLHNKLVHSRPTLPAYCVECDKNYDSMYKYKWHILNSVVHTPKSKVRIPCPECNKIFTKKIYMKDHYNLVHLKIYKYRCEKCNKNFTRNAELMKHNRRVHQHILPIKNKICYVCGSGFTTNKILLNHIRTHSGERPYECEVCAANFTQKVSLNAHKRAKHRIK